MIKKKINNNLECISEGTLYTDYFSSIYKFNNKMFDILIKRCKLNDHFKFVVKIDVTNIDTLKVVHVDNFDDSLLKNNNFHLNMDDNYYHTIIKEIHKQVLDNLCKIFKK